MNRFLRQLFDDGHIRLSESPYPPAGEERQQALDILTEAYRLHGLDVAGPPIRFDAQVALSAAMLVQMACWYLVNRQEPAEDLASHLSLAPPQTASAHLSGDLVLRYLPGLYNRALAISVTDPLTEALALVLRQWPLSGVLSTIPDGPLTPLDFDGHPGLLLLYAERLAAHEKRAWMPNGPSLEYVRLVYRDLGRENAAFLPQEGQGSDVA